MNSSEYFIMHISLGTKVWSSHIIPMCFFPLIYSFSLNTMYYYLSILDFAIFLAGENDIILQPTEALSSIWILVPASCTRPGIDSFLAHDMLHCPGIDSFSVYDILNRPGIDSFLCTTSYTVQRLTHFLCTTLHRPGIDSFPVYDILHPSHDWNTRLSNRSPTFYGITRHFSV